MGVGEFRATLEIYFAIITFEIFWGFFFSDNTDTSFLMLGFTLAVKFLANFPTL